MNLMMRTATVTLRSGRDESGRTRRGDSRDGLRRRACRRRTRRRSRSKRRGIEAQIEEFTDLRRKAIVSGVAGAIAMIAPMAFMGVDDSAAAKRGSSRSRCCSSPPR